MEIDAFLATRIRDLRKARSLTMEQLAELSGVSRSTISVIERQETSPTAVVLNRLANAFGLSLPALFAGEAEHLESVPVSRRTDQSVWTDPASGYVRRHLSPAGIDSPIELVEVTFPAGETVVFDNPLRRVGIQQQLWLIKGTMDITLDEQTWHLAAGDCLAMEPASRTAFHNPGAQSARYVLAVLTSNASNFKRSS